MRRYIGRAGLGKTGACHIFRHTMATLMLERGADVRLIQEILGHEELSTTEIYTRVSIGHLKAVHDRTHPGASSRDGPPRLPATSRERQRRISAARETDGDGENRTA